MSIGDEQEQHIMQLAVISTASIQNTESTIKDRIPRDNPYWTFAYGDVCAAVDREMRERKRADIAVEACKAAWNAFDNGKRKHHKDALTGKCILGCQACAIEKMRAVINHQ